MALYLEKTFTHHADLKDLSVSQWIQAQDDVTSCLVKVQTLEDLKHHQHKHNTTATSDTSSMIHNLNAAISKYSDSTSAKIPRAGSKIRSHINRAALPRQLVVRLAKFLFYLQNILTDFASYYKAISPIVDAVLQHITWIFFSLRLGMNIWSIIKRTWFPDSAALLNFELQDFNRLMQDLEIAAFLNKRNIKQENYKNYPFTTSEYNALKNLITTSKILNVSGLSAKLVPPSALPSSKKTRALLALRDHWFEICNDIPWLTVSILNMVLFTGAFTVIGLYCTVALCIYDIFMSAIRLYVNWSRLNALGQDSSPVEIVDDQLKKLYTHSLNKRIELEKILLMSHFISMVSIAIGMTITMPVVASQIAAYCGLQFAPVVLIGVSIVVLTTIIQYGIHLYIERQKGKTLVFDVKESPKIASNTDTQPVPSEKIASKGFFGGFFSKPASGDPSMPQWTIKSSFVAPPVYQPA
jgi:hypothetical protein